MRAYRFQRPARGETFSGITCGRLAQRRLRVECSLALQQICGSRCDKPIILWSRSHFKPSARGAPRAQCSATANPRYAQRGNR
jgi:hypothetical protein